MVTSDIMVAEDPGMAPATSLSSGVLKVSLAGLLYIAIECTKRKKIYTDYMGYTRNRKSDFHAFKTADGKCALTKAGKS